MHGGRVSEWRCDGHVTSKPFYSTSTDGRTPFYIHDLDVGRSVGQAVHVSTRRRRNDLWTELQQRRRWKDVGGAVPASTARPRRWWDAMDIDGPRSLSTDPHSLTVLTCCVNFCHHPPGSPLHLSIYDVVATSKIVGEPLDNSDRLRHTSARRTRCITLSKAVKWNDGVHTATKSCI